MYPTQSPGFLILDSLQLANGPQALLNQTRIVTKRNFWLLLHLVDRSLEFFISDPGSQSRVSRHFTLRDAHSDAINQDRS